MKYASIVFLMFVMASGVRAQDTALSYYEAAGDHPLLHFPRIHHTGTDTIALSGLAERFTSPYPTTYLDSVDIAFSLPRFVDVPNNDYRILIMGSTLDSTGEYLIADTSNVLFRYEHHPSVSEISGGHWERLAVPHIPVDTAFFVVFELTDTNASDIELGIGIDSVTYDAPQPVDDNLDRTREYGFGSQQIYVAGNHFLDLADNSIYWYSNAMFVAHVSDQNSDVTQITPSGFSVGPITPNPASQSLTVKYTVPRMEPITIQLFNEVWSLVQTSEQSVESSGEHTRTIDISQLPEGSYRCLISAGDERLSPAFDVIH